MRPVLVRQPMTGITMYRFSRFGMPRKQAAFSLIELMVTLVVLGVVMGAALPSFKSQMSRNGADALGEELISALQLARAEAIKRSGFVTLCASSNGTSCSGELDKWADGFMVVVDFPLAETTSPILTNNLNPTATILRVWQKLDAKAVVKMYDSNDVNATPVILGSARSFVRFNRMGTLAQVINSPRGVVINSKMKVKAKDAEAGSCEPRSARQYVIGLVGLVRLANETCW